MAGKDSLAPLRSDLESLLDQTEIGSRREFGRGLGWKTGEEMIRLFLEGSSEISLGKAAEWAERCGAELRAVPKKNPWVALVMAIDALPETARQTKRHLALIANSELEMLPGPTAAAVRREVERTKREATIRRHRPVAAATEPRRKRAI